MCLCLGCRLACELLCRVDFGGLSAGIAFGLLLVGLFILFGFGLLIGFDLWLLVLWLCLFVEFGFDIRGFVCVVLLWFVLGIMLTG